MSKRASDGGEPSRSSTPSAPADSLEVLVRMPGNLLARRRNVLVQVRSGEMSAEVLERIERSVLLARAATPGPVGAIAIIEDGASLAAPELRARQAALVKRLLADPRSYFVSVMLSETVASKAISAVMRLALIGTPRLRATSTLDEAARWLADALGNTSETDVRRLVDEARALNRS